MKSTQQVGELFTMSKSLFVLLEWSCSRVSKVSVLTLLAFLLFLSFNDSAPLDYTFSAPGDDWPSSSDVSSYQTLRETQARTDARRINPLRRAAKWFGSRKSETQQ